MKTLQLLLCTLATAPLRADSTITADHRYAWGANIGWTDWRADSANGAVIGEYVCSGYIYAANVGWIRLGNGMPVDGVRYQNTSAADFGVNHDGRGNLRGYAYGANIGWVNFEDRGAPRIDLLTGNLSGYVYGANVGWINLDGLLPGGARAFVRTGSLASPDSDGDGIADAYEMHWAGNLATMNGATDRDGDGISDRDEFRADTNPNDPLDFLRIMAFGTTGLHCAISWTSRPTRQYQIEKRADFVSAKPWVDSGLGRQLADPGATTTRTVPDSADYRFFRIMAVKPLAP